MSFAYQHHVDDCNCAQCDRARRAADAIIKQAMEAADREYDRRGGIPILRPIANRPLLRPAFTPAEGKDLGKWVAENCSALYDWFHATMDYGDPAETWGMFCAEQHYQQQGIDMNAQEWLS